MTRLQIWLYSIALCLFIGWTAAQEEPDETAAAQATQDWINDTAAQLVAARKDER